jgi:hypothetical protein
MTPRDDRHNGTSSGTVAAGHARADADPEDEECPALGPGMSVNAAAA